MEKHLTLELERISSLMTVGIVVMMIRVAHGWILILVQMWRVWWWSKHVLLMLAKQAILKMQAY